jgi:hypothetical protein
MKRYSILGGLLALSLPAVAAAPLQPTDFAYGLAIETKSDAPFYEFTVPQAVYETSTRADLGDVRVFNGRDEVVPHALRRTVAAKASGVWTALTLFPVRGNAAHSPGELSLRVDRNKSGSIVRVRASEGAAANAPVLLYIVETKIEEKPIRTLEVNWKDSGGEGFAGRLAVDASDDLQSWRTVASEAPVLRLRHVGELLDRRQVMLGALNAKYLRLRWVDPTIAAPALSALRVEYLVDAPPPERQWLTLATVTAGEQRGEYLYTLTGQMPIDRLRIRLPQANAVARADVTTRAERAAAWQHRAGGLIYRVSKGGTDVVQDDFVFAPISGAREWRLTLSQKDGGLGDAPPAIEVGWQPQTLVFGARGAGPYRLAYGKAGLTPADASIEQLLAATRDGQPKFVTQLAQLGTPEVLGGEKRLSLSLADRSWRIWILWAVLGTGVLLLGWMAARLARQIKLQE